MTSKISRPLQRTAHAGPRAAESLLARAAVHAALGEPARLAIVDELASSDRSPKELGERLGILSNLLSHHLDVLEEAGIVSRFSSAGDGRRKYLRLVRGPLAALPMAALLPQGDLLFLCTRNSARSQLAAAMWMARTGRPASSAGTCPAARVHRGAIAAARRAGINLDDATTKIVGNVSADTQVVTVCDRAHEELHPAPGWWHWSIPDPVEAGTASAFDDVVTHLDDRIANLISGEPTICQTR